jgi:hypothetical protein
MMVFQIVVVVVCVASAAVATFMFARASRLYDRIARLGIRPMSVEEQPRHEVKEMLQARTAPGEPPPDLSELIAELRGDAPRPPWD